MSDPKYIDAEKLKRHYAWWDDEAKKIFDEIIDLQPAADVEPRWIPVTERLPEEAGQYLVSGKWANEDGEVWICKFARLYNWGWCNMADRPVVQAWMPLPTPYKGGEKE